MGIKKYKVSRHNHFKLKVFKKNTQGETIKEMLIPFKVVDGVPGVAVITNPEQQEMIEDSNAFKSGDVFSIDTPGPQVKIKTVGGEKQYQVTPPKIVSFDPDAKEPEEPVKVPETSGEDLRFVEEDNANAAASKIKDAYGIPFSDVQGKAKLKDFAEKHNISLPLIFE